MTHLHQITTIFAVGKEMPASAWWEKTVSFLQENGLAFLINVATAILIFFVGRFIAKMLTKFLQRVMTKARLEPVISRFLGNLAYTGMLAFVIMASLERLGISTTSFAAVVAAAGLAIGLALQDSLKNFAAGIMIILFKPFNLGDYVEAGGTSGTIQEIHIFSTWMVTPDNKRVLVPNGQIIDGEIVNYSANATRRLDLVIGCGYNDNLLDVKGFLENLLQEEDRVLSDPAPVVAVHELGDSSVNFVVRPWVKKEDYWAVRWELTEKIKLGFDERGFSIPYPSHDVYTHAA